MMPVDSHSELKAEEHRITHGNRLVELKADDHLTVAGSQHLKLGTGQFIEAGEEIHYFAGEKLVLDAGSELTLKAGGSFIKLDAGGVAVEGAQVKLNSGGSAGSGFGARALTPNGSTANESSSHKINNASKPSERSPNIATTALATDDEAINNPPIITNETGPGKWVTIDIDYDGLTNTLKMFTNRLGSLGDEGRIFGSDGKDYQNTTRTITQEWRPLEPSEEANHPNSAIYPYGQKRSISQRYLEGSDNWQISGKSWHWQPVTANIVYESRGSENERK